MADQRVEVVDYDAGWPDLARATRAGITGCGFSGQGRKPGHITCM
jgi:hypothetical protein